MNQLLRIIREAGIGKPNIQPNMGGGQFRPANLDALRQFGYLANPRQIPPEGLREVSKFPEVPFARNRIRDAKRFFSGEEKLDPRTIRIPRKRPSPAGLEALLEQEADADTRSTLEELVLKDRIARLTERNTVRQMLFEQDNSDFEKYLADEITKTEFDKRRKASRTRRKKLELGGYKDLEFSKGLTGGVSSLLSRSL
jgi:hypothetical protein